MQPQSRRKVPPEMSKEAPGDLPSMSRFLPMRRLPSGSKPRCAQRYLVIRLMVPNDADVLAQVLRAPMSEHPERDRDNTALGRDSARTIASLSP